MSDYPAPIFVRGIMPRSGTNFLADILKLHADVEAHPNELWEFPHFAQSRQLVDYVRSVADGAKAHAFDTRKFMGHLGDAWLGYLYEFAPRNRRIVMKYPSVQDLASVFDFFPTCRLLVIVRDGRDVVASGLRSDFVAPPRFSPFRRRTWGRLRCLSDFDWMCRRYDEAARSLIAFETSETRQRHAAQALRVRYEDLLRDERGSAEAILSACGLDPDRFDWEGIGSLPVRGSSFSATRRTERTADFRPVGRWSNWTRRQRVRFDTLAGDANRRLGYT